MSRSSASDLILSSSIDHVSLVDARSVVTSLPTSQTPAASNANPLLDNGDTIDMNEINKEYLKFVVGDHTEIVEKDAYIFFLPFFAMASAKGFRIGSFGPDIIKINKPPKWFIELMRIIRGRGNYCPNEDTVRQVMMDEAKFYKMRGVEKFLEQKIMERKEILKEYDGFENINYNIGIFEFKSFTIKKDLILRKPSLFREILYSKKPPRDTSNTFCITRSHNNVPTIIRFLAGDCPGLGTDLNVIKALKEDSKFFEVDGLVKRCEERERYLVSLATRPTTTLSTILRPQSSSPSNLDSIGASGVENRSTTTSITSSVSSSNLVPIAEASDDVNLPPSTTTTAETSTINAIPSVPALQKIRPATGFASLAITSSFNPTSHVPSRVDVLPASSAASSMSSGLFSKSLTNTQNEESIKLKTTDNVVIEMPKHLLRTFSKTNDVIGQLEFHDRTSNVRIIPILKEQMKVIMRYMEGCSIDLGEDKQSVKRAKEAAQFMKLPGLVAICQKRLESFPASPTEGSNRSVGETIEVASQQAVVQEVQQGEYDLTTTTSTVAPCSSPKTGNSSNSVTRAGHSLGTDKSVDIPSTLTAAAEESSTQIHEAGTGSSTTTTATASIPTGILLNSVKKPLSQVLKLKCYDGIVKEIPDEMLEKFPDTRDVVNGLSFFSRFSNTRIIPVYKHQLEIVFDFMKDTAVNLGDNIASVKKARQAAEKMKLAGLVELCDEKIATLADPNNSRNEGGADNSPKSRRVTPTTIGAGDPPTPIGTGVTIVAGSSGASTILPTDTTSTPPPLPPREKRKRWAPKRFECPPIVKRGRP